MGKSYSFSSEYFTLVKPFYQLLADAGQKVITAYIKDGAFNKGQTMVKWHEAADGKWSFDYTGFDKFVAQMMSWGIGRQISCFLWWDGTLPSDIPMLRAKPGR